MTTCPFATLRPVQNHGGAMSGHLGLVLHVQQGNGSLYGYFNNPASQVSAHFWCAKDGTLEQYVDCDVVAWAEAAGNPSYLSVETEGFDTEPLNATQIDTLGRLLAWSAATYGFPTTGPPAHGQKGFTQHCNPNGTPDPTWGNHTCPGIIRLGQMSAVTQAATPPLPDIKEESVTSVFGPDGKLYVSASSAGTPASAEDNLLVFQITPGNPPTISNVVDVTAGIEKAFSSAYKVQA